MKATSLRHVIRLPSGQYARRRRRAKAPIYVPVPNIADADLFDASHRAASFLIAGEIVPVRVTVETLDG